MSGEWVILHGGALGDLALTVQLALWITDGQVPLHVYSRTNPGDLTAFNPAVHWTSSESVALHSLFETPPRVTFALDRAISGRTVVNALESPAGRIHSVLHESGAKEVLSFDPRLQPESTLHVTEQWLGQFSSIRPSSPVPPALQANERFAAQCREQLGEKLGRGIIVLIHPGSGGVKKCWPLVLYLSLAKALRSAGCGVAMVVGPVERERWKAGECEIVRDEGIRVLEPNNTVELVRLLLAANLLIGNDAGPSHLAALIGTPTLTLLGPTQAIHWRPLAQNARFLQGRADSPAWGLEPDDVFKKALTSLRFFGSPH